MKIEHLFIPVGAALQLTAADFTPDGVVVDLQTTAMIADCPTCQVPTQRSIAPTNAAWPISRLPSCRW